MNARGFKGFAVAIVCGIILALAAFLLWHSRQPRFLIVKAMGALAWKLDTDTGQMWLIRGGTEVPMVEASPDAQHESYSRAGPQTKTYESPQRAKIVTPNIILDDHRERCIEYLREIEAAKQLWALDRYQGNPPDTASPRMSDLSSYFEGGFIPKCPDGGAYTVNGLNTFPSCSLAASGHTL